MSTSTYLFDMRGLSAYRIARQRPDLDTRSSRKLAICPSCGQALLDFAQGEQVVLGCLDCRLLWPTRLSIAVNGSQAVAVEMIVPAEEIEVYDHLRHVERLQQQNREAIQEYQRQYYEENREAIQEKHRQYYEENREAIQEKQRQYYEENREAIQEYQRQYREENREAIQEKQRQYQKRRYWQKKLKRLISEWVVLAGLPTIEE